jgi:hypothetical protein
MAKYRITTSRSEFLRDITAVVISTAPFVVIGLAIGLISALAWTCW